MKLNVLLTTLAMATIALAGCADAPAEEDEIIPGSISQEQVKELEERATEQFPRRFAFPDQNFAEPIIGMFEGTLAQFSGAGVEWPDDDGNIKGAGAYLTWDLASELAIPENQPVEIRLKLKWWGDPGAAVDMDIFVDVPGEKDSYDGTSYDESWNWNIVTKFRVVNTVNLPGIPLTVGMELQNGKIVHPDGVYYQLQYEVHMPQNVLAPGIAYGLTVPDEASVLIFESEPITGDEHVTSDIVIFGPDDQFLQFRHHNDIASETQRINLVGGGEYVIFAQHYHGGFVRVETDIQNPDFMAKILTTTTESVEAFSGAAPAPTGRPSTGAIDVGSPILDILTWIEFDGPAAGAVDAEIAAVNPGGDYHVTSVSSQAGNDQLRAGPPTESSKPLTDGVPNFGDGPWEFQGRANGEGYSLGYTYTTYTR